jgi:hypothetical protein
VRRPRVRSLSNSFAATSVAYPSGSSLLSTRVLRLNLTKRLPINYANKSNDPNEPRPEPSFA